MVTDLQILAISLLSVLGAVTTATLGWLESDEPFNPRKYVASLLRATIAGLITALGFSTVTTIDAWDYIVAYLAGAGVDVFGHRIAGNLRRRVTT